MNHLAAIHRGSSLGLPMQMSTHLLEPVRIMSSEMETKAAHYTVGTHTYMSPRDTVTDERERKKTACARDMHQYMCALLTVTFTLLKYQLVHNYHILSV